MRQESDLQGREARRVSKPVPSPIGLRIQIHLAEGVGLGPTRPLRARRFSKPLPSSDTRLALPRENSERGNSESLKRMASGSNARTARHRGRCFPSRPLTSRAAIHASSSASANRGRRPPRIGLAPPGRTPEGTAESGLFESHALRHAPASNGARRACPVHSPLYCLPKYRPRDSNPDLHGLSVVPLPVGPGRHDLKTAGVTDRTRTDPMTMAKSCANR
jgi:hypothetical protein